MATDVTTRSECVLWCITAQLYNDTPMLVPGLIVVWRNPCASAALLCALAGTACGKDGPTGPKAANLVLNFASLTLSQLDSAQLIPSFVDSKGTLITGVPATFSSSDPAIASVSNIGVVKSLGPAGSAMITVRGANLSKTVPLTVQSVASKLVVTPNPGVLPQKGTLQLTARLLDRVDTPIPTATFAYESSNPSVATVSATGLVTSVGPAGSISITVRSGEFATTAQIAVTQVPTTLQVLAPSPLRLGAGRSIRLAARVLDAVNVAMQGQAFRYTSLNPSIVTVASDGTVTSVGPLGTGDVRVDVLGTSLTTTVQVQVVTATSPTGTSVDSVAFAGGYAVALTAGGQALVVGPFGNAAASIDLQSRTSTSIAAGFAAYGIAVARDQRHAYLTTANGALREIDLVTGSHNEIPLGAEGYGLAMSPDGRFAFVGTNSYRLLVVDLASRSVVARIPLTVFGLHISVDAVGRLAYVSWDGGIEEVDLTTRLTTGRLFNVPRGQATAITQDGRTLYAGTEAGAVYSVDLVAGTSSLFLATPDCGSWGIGLTPDERFLYLACSGQGRVDVLDVHSREVVRKYGGFADPRRVAISQDGAVVVVATGNVLAIFR